MPTRGTFRVAVFVWGGWIHFSEKGRNMSLEMMPWAEWRRRKTVLQCKKTKKFFARGAPREAKLDAAAADAAVASVRAFITAHFAAHDASHDSAHTRRVAALARGILAEESARDAVLAADAAAPLVVELAALLHDVDDAKYGGDAAGAPAAAAALAAAGAPAALAARVLRAVARVSWTAEAARRTARGGRAEEEEDDDACAAAVCDADRLEAIGAVGVARCFAFGGARGRPLASSVAHFREKLLRVEAFMKTRAGRARARARARLVEDFLRAYEDEAREAGEGAAAGK